MENRHKRFKGLRDHFRASRTALHSAPISDSFRGANHLGRYHSLSGLTMNKRLRSSPHAEQISRRSAQRMGFLGPLLNRRSDLSIRNGVLLYKQLIRPRWIMRAPPGSPLPAHTSGGCRFYNLSVFACLRVPLGTLVTDRFTRIWVFLFSPTTSEP